jgi:TIR domain
MVKWKWQRGAAVTEKMPLAFFSYSRSDSDFVLKLGRDLKANDALVWLDQLDIDPGRRWDDAIQEALSECQRLLVVLSPASVESTNVMDEVSYALEEKKLVIPVLYRDCTIPFRLRRVQYIDFRNNYQSGLSHLLTVLRVGSAAAERHTSRNSEIATKAPKENERSGGNHLVPLPKVGSWEELNGFLAAPAVLG